MEIIENQGEKNFSALLSQIQRCIDQKLYYVAIMASLTIPDICGAITTIKGEATQEKYEEWFDRYAAPKYKGISGHRLTGKECYFLRCSMLHQGNMKIKKLKISFCETPQTSAPVNPYFLTKTGKLLIDPKTFCNNMVYAAYEWLDVAYNDEYFKKNSENFMTLFSLRFPGF